jgi:ribonucleoside-diphosphate reductase alpha subunit
MISLDKLIQPDEICYLDINLVLEKANNNVYADITDDEYDSLLAEICVNLSTTHPLYANLGGRILVNNLHKKTLNTFSDKLKLLNINSNFLEFVSKYTNEINSIIDYNRDYIYDYFGFKTLEKSYLLKKNKIIIERPQDMIMRTAIIVSNYNLESIKKTYDKMSLGYYTHASPTLFNAGTNHMQLSSCFLLGTNDNLIDIATTWNSCAQISKWSGGLGLHISNIRGKNSLIKGTNGQSNGLVPLLKIFNDIARWVDQGGVRKGAIAIYLEPYHPDIFDFLNLRKNFGSETERARDLFLALWIPDLFMKQVENDGDWYLLSSDDCLNLPDVYGDEFDTLYWSYVNENKYREKIKARKLWSAILESQIETGMPYICYKDTINIRSNQKNIGVIKSSNLCAEIVEYSDHDETAVCNLASIALKQFTIPFNNIYEWTIYTKHNCIYCSYAKNYLNNLNINYIEIEYSLDNTEYLKTILDKDIITFPQIFINEKLNTIKHIGGWSDLYKFIKHSFDYNKLYETAYLSTKNLNQIIDINYYPVETAKKSNLRHRPIGLGIQGLADALVLMKIPYDSEESIEFNALMMETIYLAAVTASNDLAIERYEDIIKLKELSLSSKIIIPDYYDVNFYINDCIFLELYHKLKINKCEIDRNIRNTLLGSYSTFSGSPFSQGLFQFDMVTNVKLYYKDKWDILRHKVIKYGTRNSLLTALMPTASTSQILGNNECFEFFTNNIYTRKTNAGDFILVNKYLVKDLINIGLWSPELKDQIIANNGSISALELPQEIKNIYKTIWEIKQIWVLKNAIARSPFIDQTQSMNIFMAEPDNQRLSSCHFYGWKNGLKTGMYYLRTKPSIDPIKFTIDPNITKNCESCSA